MDFRWNEWNTEHVGRHGIAADEAEQVVQEAAAPYPLRAGEGKLLVWGSSLDEDGSVFVLHARPLTDREKRRYRRQGR